MNRQKLISYQWAIAIYKGDSPFNLKPINDAPETAITFDDVKDVKADFVADPFMILKNDLWYMFFEVLNSKTGFGEIGYAVSPNGINWEYKNIVLRDNFHLSYPFVFKYDDAIFMVPETRQAGEIRLYRATQFPEKWEQEKIIMKGDYVDSTFVEFNKKWWMFALNGTKDLHLYHSDSLFGEWLPHPKSPIIENDLKTSRPAGKIIKYDEKLYRLAQDGVPLYGNKVRVFEIKLMNEKHYEEQEIEASPIIKASRKGWNSIGMHHVDVHQLNKNNWLACVDGAKPKLKKLNHQV
jgi:hypothetical protein